MSKMGIQKLVRLFGMEKFQTLQVNFMIFLKNLFKQNCIRFPFVNEQMDIFIFPLGRNNVCLYLKIS